MGASRLIRSRFRVQFPGSRRSVLDRLDSRYRLTRTALCGKPLRLYSKHQPLSIYLAPHVTYIQERHAHSDRRKAPLFETLKPFAICLAHGNVYPQAGTPCQIRIEYVRKRFISIEILVKTHAPIAVHDFFVLFLGFLNWDISFK